MTDIDYFENKLAEISKAGEIETGKVISEKTAEAIKAGAHGGSRHRLTVRECLTAGYQITLERMAKLSIDFGKAANKQVQAVFFKTSNDLAHSLVEKHAVALFGSPAFDSHAASRRTRESTKLYSELDAKSKAVIEDAKHGIVGHNCYGAKEEGPFSFKPSFLGLSVDFLRAWRKGGFAKVIAIVFLIALVGWYFRAALFHSYAPPLPETAWAPLGNSEISKIEELLRNQPVRSIYIACSSSDCRSLAQSFMSLFTEIGWPNVQGDGGILASGTNGLLLNPEDATAIALKEAIEKSTRLHIMTSGVKRMPNDHNPVMLIIGVKPVIPGTSG